MSLLVKSLPVGLLLLALGSAPNDLRSPRTAATDTARVVLLGTGTPIPDPARWGPAQAIVVGGEIFVRAPETTAPARLMQDIEAMAKRLTFNLPALPASEQIIDAVVEEIAREEVEDDDAA